VDDLASGCLGKAAVVEDGVDTLKETAVE